MDGERPGNDRGDDSSPLYNERPPSKDVLLYKAIPGDGLRGQLLHLRHTPQSGRQAMGLTEDGRPHDGTPNRGIGLPEGSPSSSPWISPLSHKALFLIVWHSPSGVAVRGPSGQEEMPDGAVSSTLSLWTSSPRGLSQFPGKSLEANAFI